MPCFSANAVAAEAIRRIWVLYGRLPPSAGDAEDSPAFTVLTLSCTTLAPTGIRPSVVLVQHVLQALIVVPLPFKRM